MSARAYENFDLLVEQREDGSYRASVTSSPSRERASTDFRIPFDETRLENFLLKLDPGRARTRRGSHDPRTEAGRELGSALYGSVFSGDVAVAWARSRDAVQAEGKGLRLRLLLDRAPQIAGLPWELLYDRRSNTFLAQSERTPVVRLLDVPQVQRPLRVDGPLHVLAVISSPTDLDELDVEAEWEHVQEALADRVASGTVVLDRLPAPTLSALGQWLRRHTVHVLHFVGHGDFDERREDGVLFFCDEYGRGAPVTASVLGPYIFDHDPLRLIVLNACRSSSVRTDDPFAGMAQGLVQQNAGAVIAMQFPITDRAAITFTGEFYGAVADGYPVDQAATYARKALSADFGSEWATPTVFIQSADGVVFDNITAPPEGTPERPHPEEPPPGPADGGEARPREPGTVVVSTGHRRRRRLTVGAFVVGAGIVVALAMRSLIDGGGGGSGEEQESPTDTADGPVVPLDAGPALTAAYLPEVEIDGDLSDWPVSPVVTAEKVVQLEGQERQVDSTWRLGWDEDRLLVLVEVIDLTLTQTHADDPAAAVEGDSVHFEFGPYLEQVRTDALDSRDRQVVIAPTEEGSTVAALNIARGARIGRGPSLNERDLDAEMRPTPRGYLIEAAVPWATLGVEGASGDDRFAMNLNVSDAIPSGEERGQLATLQSNNAERKDNGVAHRHRWGTLELLD